MRILCLLLLLAARLWAHHEAAITIAELTEQISRTPLPELYYQRGVEVFNLQDYPKARADFDQALKLRPDYLPAKRYLAIITAQEGNIDQALGIIQSAMVAAPEEHQFLIPGCHQLEAELLLKSNRLEPALKAVQEALKATVPDLASVRLEAHILRQLGRGSEAVDVLKAAWEKSRAVILRNEWLDALIDLGRADEALPVIEKELAESRIRSSWLIRRARIFLKTNRAKEAQADLQEAIDELTPRLATTPPPALLLCDRGLAYALLGQKAAAQTDLEAARKLGVSETSCRLLVATLGAR